jgi:hypothetical protein
MSRDKNIVESPQAEIEEIDEDEFPCLMKFYEELQWASDIQVTKEDIGKYQTDLWRDIYIHGVSFFYTVLPEKKEEED